jgi:hypothetical protein
MASAAQVLVQKIPTKLEVLELYKNLLMGRKTFKYTDPNWYTKKIRHEFKKNKELQDRNLLFILFKCTYFYHQPKS